MNGVNWRLQLNGFTRATVVEKTSTRLHGTFVQSLLACAANGVMVAYWLE